MRANSGIFTNANFGTAIIAIPYGNTMSPPKLTGNAPITDIFHPTKIYFIKTRRHKPGITVFHGFNGRLGQGFHSQEPLLGNQGFYRSAAAIAMTNGVNMHTFIAAAAEFACDTVVKASDTIVRSEDGSFITEIPPRDPLYQGQTPQSFKIKLLRDCFNEMTPEEQKILTDACKICVLKGHPVRLVDGEVLNFKITTVGDYQMARAMLLIK